MPKYVEMPGGGLAEFPDAMPDAQIEAALAAQPAASSERPGPLKRLGSIVGEELLRTPGRVVEGVKGAIESVKDPSMATVLPLALPGGGTVVTRLGAIAAGRMLDQPSTSPTENLETAAKGAALPAALEATVPFVGKLVRSLPGMKGRIAGQDAARVGKAIEQQTGGVLKARTADELRTMAAGPGREALGAAKEQGVQAIEQTIGGRPISVPALGPEPLSLREANNALSEIGARAFSRNPLDRTFQGVDQRQLYGRVAREIRAGIEATERAHRAGVAQTADDLVARGTRRALPPAGGATVAGPPRRIAAGEGVPDIPEAGHVASMPSVAEVAPTTSTGVRGRLVGPREPQAALGTGEATPSRAAAMWDEIQDKYNVGRALLKPLTRENAFRRYPSELQFNTPDLQRYIANPKNEAALRNKLGDARFEAFVDALTRGGGIGKVDVLTSGRGGAMDALEQVLRGSNTGFSQTWRLPIATAFPNIGSRYAGRAPYALPPQLRAILDVALQRAGGAGLEGRR